MSDASDARSQPKASEVRASARDGERRRSRQIRASGAAVAATAALWAFAVVVAPVDAMQGAIQKILYVHVPCAFSAYAGFLTTALCSALYLWSNDERFDRLAAAIAQRSKRASPLRR